MKQDKRIGIIGVGRMGEAFIKTLSTSYYINIWNRTPKLYVGPNLHKVNTLKTVPELLEYCEIVIILVDQFKTILKILEDVSDLSNKKIINCTTLSCNEAQYLQKLIKSKNGTSFNAVIDNLPKQIGTKQAKLRCLGHPEMWKSVINIINKISPNYDYIDSLPDKINIVDDMQTNTYIDSKKSKI
ncbi:NAD(P)-binding domain-containing protein [Acinetobacter calcoaceticus]|uniref:NAD(P)-binding domain-containing protein n=1 Tax=Acinetobacter calcoaceticus TaxID=471 RepID=UPI002B2BFC48|nr:NAD(P)-binding domain-containing protein [Acinetobacter baumannii]